MARTHREDGFTLVELMVVVLILGIILSIAFVSYASAVTRAQSATCAANRRTLAGAVEAYDAANGAYPDDISQLAPYIENFGLAHKCPSGVDLQYDPTTHEITCPVHGD